MEDTRDKILLQSRNNNFSRVLTLFGVPFFGWMCYISREAVYKSPPDIVELIVFLAFVGFSLWSFIGIWYYFDKILLYNDRLEAINFGGFYQRTIYFADIIDARIKHKKTEHYSWDELVLSIKDNKKYKIYSSSYHNFHEIERFIERKKGIRYKKAETKRTTQKAWSLLFYLTISLMCIGGAVYCYQKSNNYQLNAEDLVTTELTLAEKPNMVKGSKGSKSINIKIQEYPDFQFNISGVKYKATLINDFIANTEGGSRLTFLIDKEDYQQKLVKIRELTFWNKYFNYKTIDFYEIKDEKQVYLSKKDFIKEQKDDYEFVYIAFIGLSLFFMFLYWCDEHRKKR